MNNFFSDKMHEIIILSIINCIIALINTPLSFLQINRQQTGMGYFGIFQKKLKKHGWSIFYTGFLSCIFYYYASSFSFEIAENISVPILKKFDLDYTLIGIIIRTICLGLTDTILITYFEFKMTSKQKHEFIASKPSILSIIIPCFVKNTIMWGGTTFSIYIIYYLSTNMNIKTSHLFNNSISFVFGIIFAIISLPFELASVQAVGHEEKNISTFKILYTNIKKNGLKRVFDGGTIFVIEMTVFTVLMVFAELLINQRY